MTTDRSFPYASNKATAGPYFGPPRFEEFVKRQDAFEGRAIRTIGPHDPDPAKAEAIYDAMDDGDTIRK